MLHTHTCSAFKFKQQKSTFYSTEIYKTFTKSFLIIMASLCGSEFDPIDLSNEVIPGFSINSNSESLSDPLADDERSWADIMDDDDQHCEDPKVQHQVEVEDVPDLVEDSDDSDFDPDEFEDSESDSDDEVEVEVDPNELQRKNAMLRPETPLNNYQIHNNQLSLNRQRQSENNKDQQYNGYCFTIHNWTPHCLSAIQRAFDMQRENIQYAAIGDELGKENSPHLQGCLFLKGKKRIRPSVFLRDYLAVLQHTCWPKWYTAHGTQKSNERYCSKEGRDIWEWGQPLPDEECQQGKRNDLKRAYETIEENIDNCDELELAKMCPNVYFKHNRAFLRVRALMLNKRNKRRKTVANNGPVIIWCFGETGTGKSHYVRTKIGDLPYYVKGPGKWWDMYDQEKIIWMDDFRKDWMTFGYLLKVLDKYHLNTEFKGGYTSLGNVETVYITAPWHPVTMYGTKGDRVNQLLRRIYDFGGSVLEFKSEVDPNDATKSVRWTENWDKERSNDLVSTMEAMENSNSAQCFTAPPPYNPNQF